MKFKKGDKVIVYDTRIYHHHGSMGSVDWWGPWAGIITNANLNWGTAPGFLEVKDPYGDKRPVHPYQCRHQRTTK